MISRIRDYFEKHSSFFRGIAQINPFGDYYHRLPSWMDNNLTPEQQDYLAIKRDWENIGRDLEKSIEKFNLNKK